MRMVEAASRDRISPRQPRDSHRHGVEHRNHQRQQRHREPRRQRTLAEAAALNRQHSQHESDRERAFIAHENRRGWKVENHESRQRSGYRQRRDHRPGVLMQPRDGRDTQRRDNSHSRGESVDSVDQIKSVGCGDQPENRQRDVDGLVGEKIELRAPADEHADRGQFEHQFMPRPQIDDVVEQSDDAHRDRESRQPRDTVRRQARQDSDESDRGYEPGQHRHASEQSGRLLVRAVARRLGDDPPAERGRLCHRHQDRCNQKGR